MDSKQSATHVHVTTTIGRPAAEVFDYITDPANVPQWSAVVNEVENSDAEQGEPGERGRKVGVGTRRGAKIRVLGMKMSVRGEIKEFDPERRRVVMRTECPAKGYVDTIFHVEDLGESCVVHFENHVVPPQWMFAQGLTRKLIANTAESSLNQTVRNIRNILEDSTEHGVKQAEAYAMQTSAKSV